MCIRDSPWRLPFHSRYRIDGATPKPRPRATPACHDELCVSVSPPPVRPCHEPVTRRLGPSTRPPRAPCARRVAQELHTARRRVADARGRTRPSSPRAPMRPPLLPRLPRAGVPPPSTESAPRASALALVSFVTVGLGATPCLAQDPAPPAPRPAPAARRRLGERGRVDGHEERAEQRHEIRVRDEPAIAGDLCGREPDVHDFTRRARVAVSVGTA